MTPDKRKRIRDLSVDVTDTLMTAFRRMDEHGVKLLFVFEGDVYQNIVSAGDIQRAIIAGRSMDLAVSNVLRSHSTVASTDDDFEATKSLMLKHRIEFLPVLNPEGELTDALFWQDVFEERFPPARKIDLPVVIMAGGKGTRLKPFTNVLPKALFPLGEQTILERIMNKFGDAGCNRFILSVNYRHEFIRNYLGELEGKPYVVDYVQEREFLGTAGSLHLAAEKISERFFVSNCDIVIEADYSAILDYHLEAKNEITLVGAVKHIKIPYGTLQTGAGGQLKGLKEKPDLSFLVNAGLYLLEEHIIDEIPKDTFCHITDLIASVRGRGGRVGVFPVSENSWSDIGEWAEYRRAMAQFRVAAEF